MEELYHERGILSMEIPLYLSMTAAEFSSCMEFPIHTAWMACHFSPYGTGLTNLPARLPKGSLLILNDRTPVHRHDPIHIRQMLADTVSSFGCSAILLDMQRRDSPETKTIVQNVLTLPYPVCVSDVYAKELDCPVFLPPVPLTQTPEAYFSPWKGREIWLDVTMESAEFTITANGSKCCPYKSVGEFPFREERLCCHYRAELQNDCARFYLHRTKEDIYDLLSQSAAYGVTTGVGLWQELN